MNSKEDFCLNFVQFGLRTVAIFGFWQSDALITRLDLIRLGNTERNKRTFFETNITWSVPLIFSIFIVQYFPLRVFCSSNKPTMLRMTHEVKYTDTNTPHTDRIITLVEVVFCPSVTSGN